MIEPAQAVANPLFKMIDFLLMGGTDEIVGPYISTQNGPARKVVIDVIGLVKHGGIVIDSAENGFLCKLTRAQVLPTRFYLSFKSRVF